VDSEYKYNSWPLGNLPEDWQRPEPAEISKLGYAWNDPREIVEMFEKKLAKFSGSKFCVLTDSATSAIMLCLARRALNQKKEISIPVNTYVSVAMQILLSGNELSFRKEKWSGIYEIGDTGILDGAGRFAPGMYEGGDKLQVLSFQIKKRLPIGKGGAILTDSQEDAHWLKLASYDGRDLKSKYDSQEHVTQLGWHCYMTPEDAARGILLMDKILPPYNDTMTWNNYPPINSFEFFKNYRNEP
jgi:hypothetical protein